MLDTREFSGWPSGDGKPVIELNLLPKDMESRYGLTFFREKDDLDWYVGSHFNDAVIGPVVMMRHENSPSSGTIIYVDVGIESIDAIKRIRHVLEITEGEVAWNVCS